MKKSENSRAFPPNGFLSRSTNLGFDVEEAGEGDLAVERAGIIDGYLTALCSKRDYRRQRSASRRKEKVVSVRRLQMLIVYDVDV
jgi:hypothetical protein